MLKISPKFRLLFVRSLICEILDRFEFGHFLNAARQIVLEFICGPRAAIGIGYEFETTNLEIHWIHRLTLNNKYITLVNRKRGFLIN